jgi:hypothetical protein
MRISKIRRASEPYSLRMPLVRLSQLYTELPNFIRQLRVLPEKDTLGRS